MKQMTRLTINRLLFAIFIVILATVIRILLLQLLDTKFVWITYYPAVTIVALHSGFIGGFIAICLSAFIVAFPLQFFTSAPFMQSSSDLIALGIFVFNCIIISIIVESMIQSKDHLRESQHRYYHLAEQAPVGIVTCDREGYITYANTKILKLFNISSIEDAYKVQLTDSILIKKYLALNSIEESMKNNESKTFETSYISRNGKNVWLRVHIVPYIYNEEVNGAQIIVDDITNIKKTLAEIEFISFHDQLTKLYNRRYFEEELVRLDKKINLPLSLVIIDVNGLKLVNDAFGHAMGDKLLVKVAEIIKKGCRQGDIISRIGGDEFVIILPKTNLKQTDDFVKRMESALQKEKLDFTDISVSYGYDTKLEQHEDINDIFKKAEEFMYRRKLFESSSMHHKTIDVIMKTLYEKNIREEGHSVRVSELSFKLGLAINYNNNKINELQTVALMHDIGKIAIDSRILDKEESLNFNEWKEIKRHPEIGYNILSSVNEYAPLADIVLSHHERWDGKGYPRGLKGEEIPIEARIIAIADAYDAMTSSRPYRTAIDKINACEELKRISGKQLDPSIVDIFIKKII